MPVFRDDPELLAAFRRGERSALERVYWTYVQRVERIVRYGHALTHKGSRVAGALRGEVADLVQETFSRAFAPRARMAYDGARPYGPYLSMIARNLLTDWARKRGRLVAFDELLDEDEAPEPAQDDELPWADADTLRLVERYLASLDADLRAVHRERYERGLSQLEAATALGLTRQQLRTREARLRDGLAAALRELGQDLSSTRSAAARKDA
jgi:RNA polymerase sigma factor (sigma-70 family)